MRVLWKAMLAIGLVAPLAAWAFIKPVRVFAPELEGLTCVDRICVDDPSCLAEAATLYRDARQFVQASVGALQAEPRAVFCAMAACSAKFGFAGNQAYTVGTAAIVISHRGWRPYFVRHEAGVVQGRHGLLV
jgi:hypothetical protein